MTEEEKKVAIGDLYEKINKAQQAAQHQSVLEHTDKSKKYPSHHYFAALVLKVDPEGQPWAKQARLIALIKTKNFEQAQELIKGKEAQFAVEAAYILHRQGKNAEALQALQKGGNAVLEQNNAKHLLAQIVRAYLFNDYNLNVF